MTWQYDAAGPGAVALMGELPARATLALGLGASKEAAATLAVSNLMADFSLVWDAQCRAWNDWLADSQAPAARDDIDRALALSATVLKVHQDRTYRGAAVASLSAPWGDSSQSRGGYHLVWARDLVETAGALVALEAHDDARDILRYLIATQQSDGHWFQNQWLGGEPFWEGMQLDEAAFPILLASMLRERSALAGIPVTDAIRRAAGFIARTGPATSQDRWEEDAGINVFTLAVAIAALVEAAAFLDGEAKEFRAAAGRLLERAAGALDRCRRYALARRFAVHGYYIRTLPVSAHYDEAALSAICSDQKSGRRSRPAGRRPGGHRFPATRALRVAGADDPHIRDSLKIVDGL